jgi:hypothetical protein
LDTDWSGRGTLEQELEEVITQEEEDQEEGSQARKEEGLPHEFVEHGEQLVRNVVEFALREGEEEKAT